MIDLTWVWVCDPLMFGHGALKEYLHILISNELIHIRVRWDEIHLFIDHWFEEVFILIDNINDFFVQGVVSEIYPVLHNIHITI